MEVFSSKTHHLSYNDKETSDKPKLRDILQNRLSLLFKTVKVMKDKEMARSSSKLKCTKEI